MSKKEGSDSVINIFNTQFHDVDKSLIFKYFLNISDTLQDAFKKMSFSDLTINLFGELYVFFCPVHVTLPIILPTSKRCQPLKSVNWI